MRVVSFVVGLACLAGCTRAHYRNSADHEVYPILGDRARDAGFATDRLQLDPPPLSRVADPTDPDHPPKPPDDPAAAVLMAHPNGMKGAHWPKASIDWIEPPGWENGLPWTADGKLKLDAEKSFELALLHSREYQTALERLYLAALTLTLNRFEFDARWALQNSTVFNSVAPGTALETNTLTSNSNFGFRRSLAAGGQLVVDFANSFILEYTGSGRTSVSSGFVGTFVQPLLRNAGRRVRLEGLTQAERDVLYAARDFYRFRKQFWATVTTLDGGYLSLLLQVQTIRNVQLNLVGQERNLREHEALLPGGKITTVQVDQAFQGYQGARQTVAQAEASLQSQLDTFKILLGLPPRIPIELDDAVLNPFVLNDPKLEALRDELDAYQKARNRDVDAAPSVADLKTQYQEFDALAGRLRPFVEAVANELNDWGKSLDPAKSDEASRRVRVTYELFRETVPETGKDVDRLRNAAKTDAAALAEAKRKEGWEALALHTRRLISAADQLLSIQAQIRINRIELPAVTWTGTDALAYAHYHRLDLMNGQAQVTDAWRKVLVAANQLKSDLNIVASANLATPNDARTNLFNFSGDAARYSVGVQFDGPLNRQAARNAYRSALITYQQARRSYMLQSDRVEQAIRSDLRQLELQRVNVEVARLTVISAARQLEAARQQNLRGKEGVGSSSSLDILNALNTLLTARNGLAAGYISYEQLRVQLLLDLEALELDVHGYPIDERRSLSPDSFAGDRAEPPPPTGAGPVASGGPGRPPARLTLPPP
ncbi:MAG TPA: TolC family protein [Gemmataceae bacterium]|jgi:outer membrane protein TolC|nr:TolC family protein [Gemmataceae bacterium]